jgi:anti-anti-sigma factor
VDYEFIYEGEFLIIKLSGTALLNERLLFKKSLIPHLQKSHKKVLIDLSDLNRKGGVYALGILNMIKKEVQIMGGEMRLCSLNSELYRYFQENRLYQVFNIKRTIQQAKRSFKERNDET